MHWWWNHGPHFHKFYTYSSLSGCIPPCNFGFLLAPPVHTDSSRGYETFRCFQGEWISQMLLLQNPIVCPISQFLPRIPKAVVIFLYEVTRAMVVVKLTAAAGSAIPASDFSVPIFGPIFCGTIAGCGGAFFPLNKGLDPIKKEGLAPNMISALIAATFYHLFVNTSLSNGVIDASKKAHVVIATGFVLHNFVKTFHLFTKPKDPVTKVKKEA